MTVAIAATDMLRPCRNLIVCRIGSREHGGAERLEGAEDALFGGRGLDASAAGGRHGQTVARW